MYKLKLRTKIEVLVAIAFLILLVVSSVISISRTISDTHDDIDTFIRNSNGNYWSATGANIQTAIDNLGIVAPINSGYGGTHGYVWLPGNTSITVSSTINIKDHITLDMQGCEIKPDGDFDVIMLDTGAQIRNGIINVSGIANFESKAIMANSKDLISGRQHPVIIEDMTLVSTDGNGEGICFNTSGSGDQIVSGIRNNRIDIKNFEYAIHLNHTCTGGSYVNANMFKDIVIFNCTYPITVYESTAEATANFFNNIQVYCNSSTEYIVWNNGKGNQYNGIFAHNWDNNSGTRTSYNFAESHWCYLCFIGGGNDISFPSWHKWNECHTILDLENSELLIGIVTEYNP